MPMIPADPGRLEGLAARRTRNNYGFLRILLATLVIFSHSWPLLHGRNDNRAEPFYILTHGQRTGGEIAVDAFFILSGFLITQSWLHAAGVMDYLLRRALRIYPGFLAAATISALLAAPLLEPDPAAYWRAFDWRGFSLGLMDLRLESLGTVPVNGSLWSIRYEFLCYLGVIALGLGGILARRAWIVAAFSLALIGLALQLNFGMRIPGARLSGLIGWVGFWPRLSANFLVGMLFYVYRDRITLSARGMGLALTGLIVAAVQPWAQILPVAFPPLGGYVLFYFAYVGFPRLHDWTLRRDLSYGLYLYAFPIQKLLGRWVLPLAFPSLAARPSSLPPVILFLAATPLAAAFAALSWRFVESPAIGLRGAIAAWIGRRVAGPAARVPASASIHTPQPPRTEEVPVPSSVGL